MNPAGRAMVFGMLLFLQMGNFSEEDNCPTVLWLALVGGWYPCSSQLALLRWRLHLMSEMERS
jgi:hypothetical protein